MITLTEPFGPSESYNAGTQLSFKIASGTNPTSVKDAGVFVFNTYKGTDNQVGRGSASDLYTPTIGTITDNLEVTSSSSVTYSAPETYSL